MLINTIETVGATVKASLDGDVAGPGPAAAGGESVAVGVSAAKIQNHVSTIRNYSSTYIY